MIAFLHQNLRWLGIGFLLTFSSAFGQTWFISLFAGGIKAAHGLSDGGWGSLYTVATLAAAGLLFATGALADTMRLDRLAPLIALVFALSALAMAFANSIWMLGIAVFGLRFCGQGMFGHIAMTALGRWFRARRGRAVAVVTMGHPSAEAFWPLLAVFALGVWGAKIVWIVIAALLAFAVAPILLALLSRGRSPAGGIEGGSATGMRGRHWTRSEAVRHWLFAALVPMILTAGFIGTVVYFHQSSIAQDKGWTLAAMAPGYVSYAVLATAGALAGGWIADRFGPDRLLPAALLPMGAGITLVWIAHTVPLWFAALGLIGLTHGLNSALWGAFLPAVYGTRHLGAVRSLVTAIMVISTAIGPGATGLLIDWGIPFPMQSLFMGAWCFGLSAFALFVRRKLVAEAGSDGLFPEPAAR